MVRENHADEDDEDMTEHELLNAGGYYGRPRWKLQYYSNGIRARAFKSFETREEAENVRDGLLRIGEAESPEESRERIGVEQEPELVYEEDYGY